MRLLYTRRKIKKKKWIREDGIVGRGEKIDKVDDNTTTSTRKRFINREMGDG